MHNDGKIAGETHKKSVPDFIANRDPITPKRSGKLIAVGLIVFLIGAALVVWGHLSNPDDRVRSFFVKDGSLYTSSSSAMELSQDDPLFRILNSSSPELVRNLETIKDQKRQAKYLWLAGYPIVFLGIVLFGIGLTRKKFKSLL